MAFWVLLLIQIATYVLGVLLRPKLPGSGQNAAKPDIATAKEGDPIPVFFGRVLLAGNVVWWGDLIKGDGKEWETNVPEGVTTFYLRMMQVLGWGPIDVLFDVWLDSTKKVGQLPPQTDQPPTGYTVGAGWSGGTTIPALILPTASPTTVPWTNPHAASILEVDVRALRVYGGVKQQGGVEGPVFLHTGDTFGDGQTADTDTYLDNFLNSFTPHTFFTNLPHLVYAGYGGASVTPVYMGVSSSIKPWLWEVGRYPNNLGDATKCRIVDDANPAEMIWEILTSELWGVGMPVADLDMDAFLVARDQLYTEGAGMSLILSGRETADTTLSDILRHIDGVIVEDPMSGLIRLKLIRKDYVTPSLPQIADTNGTAKSVTLARTQWRELLTDIHVHYTNRAENYKEGLAQFQNMALWQRTNERRADDIQYLGFTTADNVKHAGDRALRTLSTPLARGQIVCGGVGQVIAVGDPFKLTWEPLGLSDMIVRATKVNYGDDAFDPVTIDYVEDIFGDMTITYLPPPDSGWIDPRSTYRAPTVTEYITETGTTGTVELAVYDPDSHVTAVEYAVQVGTGTTGAYASFGTEPYIHSITKDTILPTTVYWRVTYTASDATSQTIIGSHKFDPKQKPSPPHLNPIANAATGDTVYASVTDAITTTIKFAYSKVAFPTLATVRATTAVAVPTSGTITQATSTLAPEETLFFTTLAYDAASNESEPSFEQTTRGTVSSSQYFDLVFEFGDGITAPNVSAIAGDLGVDVNATIVSWTIVGDVSGSAVVDIQSATFANPPTFASIAGTNLPTLTSQTAVRDTTLTGWGTTAITAGTLFRGVLSSFTTLKKITVTLKCLRL